MNYAEAFAYYPAGDRAAAHFEHPTKAGTAGIWPMNAPWRAGTSGWKGKEI